MKTFSILLISFGILFSNLEIGKAKIQSKLWCHDFFKNLKYKDKGKEVEALQTALKKEGFFENQISGFFDFSTFNALKSFQEKYRDEILAPLKLKSGTGFFGILTRTKMNQIYGCTKIEISSFSLYPGESLVVKIKNGKDKIQIKFGNILFEPLKIKENYFAFFPIRINEKAKEKWLEINFPEGAFFKKRIEILKKRFPEMYLPISKKLIEKGFDSFQKIEKGIKEDNLYLKNLFLKSNPDFYFSEPFSLPMNKIIISEPFGQINRGEKSFYYHLGVDLGGEKGEPIFATNDGKIVFAEELKTYGKTVVIDHGGKIFSLYLHLDEIKKPLGRIVKKGEEIGTLGETGYATNPHLHFSIKVNGISIDPIKFIEITQKELKE